MQLTGDSLVQWQDQVYHPNVDHANLELKPVYWSHVVFFPLLQTMASHKQYPCSPIWTKWLLSKRGRLQGIEAYGSDQGWDNSALSRKISLKMATTEYLRNDK